MVDVLGFGANPIIYLSIVLPLIVAFFMARNMLPAGLIWGALSFMFIVTSADVPLLNTIVWILIPVMAIYVAFELYTRFTNAGSEV